MKHEGYCKGTTHKKTTTASFIVFPLTSYAKINDTSTYKPNFNWSCPNAMM